MKRTTTTTAAIGLSLAAALTLSACANPLDALIENVVGGGVENLIENELGGDVDINFGEGADLPAAWPAEIPVPDGEILLSGSSDGTSTVSINTTEASAEQTQAKPRRRPRRARRGRGRPSGAAGAWQLAQADEAGAPPADVLDRQARRRLRELRGQVCATLLLVRRVGAGVSELAHCGELRAQ